MFDSDIVIASAASGQAIITANQCLCSSSSAERLVERGCYMHPGFSGFIGVNSVQFTAHVHHSTYLALKRHRPNECVICLTISNAGIPLRHGEADGVYAQAG